MSVIPTYLLPETSTLESGRLKIGGCDVLDLVEKYGSPLFIYDEEHIRSRAREAVAAFPDGVAYASKAFICRAILDIVTEEGMMVDVSTEGELFTAVSAGIEGSKLVMHGNNKSDTELQAALKAGVSRIVVDSFDEIERLRQLAPGHDSVVQCLIRVTPGVEAHTHEYVQTGQADSKFGFGLHTGDADRAFKELSSIENLHVVGMHIHIGSQIFDASFFAQAVEVVADLVRAWGCEELSIGGGLGVAYVNGEPNMSLTEWGAILRNAISSAGLGKLRITAEPGRSIVASSAITCYRVGTIKEIADIRTYVSVDGGMSDNPRPVLYGSGYESFLPRAVDAERNRMVTVVGKHCESGDVLVPDALVPNDFAVGDIIATPVSGAYGYSMASNYNRVPKPAVIFVRDGSARIAIRRETMDDLTRLDS